VSCSIFKPTVIAFTTRETGIAWPSWLNRLLEAARDKIGKTCSGQMYVTEIETTEISHSGVVTARVTTKAGVFTGTGASSALSLQLLRSSVKLVRAGKFSQAL